MGIKRNLEEEISAPLPKLSTGGPGPCTDLDMIYNMLSMCDLGGC